MDDNVEEDIFFFVKLKVWILVSISRKKDVNFNKKCEKTENYYDFQYQGKKCIPN